MVTKLNIFTSKETQLLLSLSLFVIFLTTILVFIKEPQGLSKKAIESSPKDISEIYPLNIDQPIYKLSLSGNINLLNDSSFLRIILIDKNKNEYLVYETSPLLSSESSFSFENVCEETCLLSGTIPDHLRIEGFGSSYAITNVSSEKELSPALSSPTDFNAKVAEIKRSTDNLKIQKLQEQIKVKGLKWTPGETSISQMTYSQKKKLFSKPDGTPVDVLPNLQGFEYYKGGIFEIKTDKTNLDSRSTPIIRSKLPTSWDWRTVHGENWMTYAKDQSYCGSCWAFSSVAATEANINLYFNQHLDFDLSEQDAVSCSGVGSCRGGWPAEALNYFKDIGVTDETCFSYQANDIACQNKCRNSPFRTTKIGGNNKINYYDFYPNETAYEKALKTSLVKQGVLNATIDPWNHAMALIGYNNRSDWKYIGECLEDQFCSNGQCVPKSCSQPDQELTVCINSYYSGNYSSMPDWGTVYTYSCEAQSEGTAWNFAGKSYCNSNEVCVGGKCQDKTFYHPANGLKACYPYDIHMFPNEVWQYTPGQGENYWVFKNSWGTNWGENGFARLEFPLHDIYEVSVPLGPFLLPKNSSLWPNGFNGQIQCVDRDNDSYCNWGISETKPSTCPSSCKPQKDCDDSSPMIGPFDANYNCLLITPTPQVTLKPIPTSKIGPPLVR